MEIGVFVLIWLTLAFLDQLPAPKDVQCNIVSASLCTILNKDPYTIVLIIWASLQLVWVTMLLIVQFMQIARAQTTYESMRGHMHAHPHGAGDALTTFATTGAISTEDAQIGASNRGPDPVAAGPKRKEGCFEQWKRLLGLDTFMATAIHGSNAEAVQQRQRQNPFTRGMLTNCKEFWFDGTPVFGYRKESGMARLGGERVDYTRMYEAPARMVYRGDGGGPRYEAVGSEDNV